MEFNFLNVLHGYWEIQYHREIFGVTERIDGMFLPTKIYYWNRYQLGIYHDWKTDNCIRF